MIDIPNSVVIRAHSKENENYHQKRRIQSVVNAIWEAANKGKYETEIMFLKEEDVKEASLIFKEKDYKCSIRVSESEHAPDYYTLHVDWSK